MPSAPRKPLYEDASPALLPRGPAAPPRDVVATVHRQRLLRAMAQAVAEKGYVATNIADIVGRARVSRSAFYACFPDKETCFLAGYSEEADRHFELIAAAANQPDWWDQLRAGVQAYVRELELNPRFAKSFLVEILTAGPTAIELRTVVYERYAALMKDWYERAPAALALPALPDQIYRAAVGATNELVATHFEREDSGDEQALEQLVLYSLLALFGLTGAAREALRRTERSRPDQPPG